MGCVTAATMPCMSENANQESAPLRLRVTDDIRQGVFATGLLVYTGTHEFVLDFIQNIEHPVRVVSRIVVPRPALAMMIEVVRQGVALPAPQPQPLILGATQAQAAAVPSQEPMTVQQPGQVYDDLKLPDVLHKGAYANALITAHNDEIFRMDFVAQLCPEPVLSARIHLTKGQAAHVRAMLEHVWRGSGGDPA